MTEPSVQTRQGPSIGPRRAALVAFLMVFLGAMGIAAVYGNFIDHRAQDRINATGELVANRLQDGLDHVIRELRGYAGLFLASEHVSPAEFRRYSALTEYEGGVQGWGVVKVVRHEEVDGFVGRAAREWPNFTPPTSLQDRPIHYFVVDFVTFRDDLRPVGMDAGAVPDQREALNRATATGRVASSTWLRLTASNEIGFVLSHPVVNDSGIVDTIIFSPVVLDEFIAEHIPREMAEQVDVRMEPLNLLADRVAPPDSGVMRTLMAGGHAWLATVTPARNSDLLPPNEDIWLAVLVSLALAILAGIATYALVRRRETQLELAETIRLNKARDQFLGVISHEIRTPLTAVVGFTHELRNTWENLSAEERVEMLRMIDEQGREVSAIVADLLVIGRAEVDSLHLSVSPTGVDEAVRLALDSLPENGYERVTASVNGDRVIADRSRLSQILRNLLVNAVQYGGPNVAVETVAGDDSVKILVSDDGEGIPEKFREAVFDPYFNIPRDGQPLPSVGLGLYVARRLTEVMGGTLVYRREAERSVFEVTLPRAAPRAATVGV